MTEVLTYEALKAERDALAVENAALKDVFGPGEAVVNFLSIALRHTECDYIDLPDVALAFKMSLPETPATDAALAAIQARAKAEAFAEIIEFIDRRSGLAEMKTPWDLSSAIVAHIAELREAK